MCFLIKQFQSLRGFEIQVLSYLKFHVIEAEMYPKFLETTQVACIWKYMTRNFDWEKNAFLNKTFFLFFFRR